jgi:release factor glutamine methyltransferase
VGHHEFHGLRLAVRPGVLDPRPDTEVLVDWALALLDGPLATQPAPAVLDLGTGSGAIALAGASTRGRARVTATDRSAEALAVAQANGLALGLAVEWRAGDWWAAVAGRRFDLVLSNPPYLAEDDPHLPALRHEPREALVAADQGLADLHALADTAGDHLRPGGWLLLEHGHAQGDAVAARLRAAGFVEVTTHADLAGRPRCTGGRWPGA